VGCNFSIKNLLIQTPGSGQRFHAKLPIQNLLEVAELGQSHFGVTALHQILHQQTMKALPAWIENQGLAANVYGFGVLA